jgi:hypothetical protein
VPEAEAEDLGLFSVNRMVARGDVIRHVQGAAITEYRVVEKIFPGVIHRENTIEIEPPTFTLDGECIILVTG